MKRLHVTLLNRDENGFFAVIMSSKQFEQH